MTPPKISLRQGFLSFVILLCVLICRIRRDRWWCKWGSHKSVYSAG